MKSPRHAEQTDIGDGSCVPFDVHRSTRLFVFPLSTKISSSALTNKLKGTERFARIVVVGLRLPLRQMRIRPFTKFATKRVSSVLTKRPNGWLPMMLELATVVALGFHEALAQNFG